MSDWFYDKEISLLKESDGYMYHGVWKDGTLTVLKTIPCDVQPANRDLIFKEYGYYIDCKLRIFCDIDSDILIGDIIEYKGTQYKIVNLIPWDDYFDMFADEV